MLLIIDNYDSFTFNLVQYLGELGADVQVARNDSLSLDDVARMAPQQLVLSPGPCTPAEAGISVALVQRFAGVIPILGVCLGHQCIGAAFGARVVRAERVMHGKTSEVFHDGRRIYADLPPSFEAMRYHSLLLDRTSLPASLVITAWTQMGEIMGVRHRTLAVEGVQFHPESILTKQGKAILQRFLRSSLN